MHQQLLLTRFFPVFHKPGQVLCLSAQTLTLNLLFLHRPLPRTLSDSSLSFPSAPTRVLLVGAQILASPPSNAHRAGAVLSWPPASRALCPIASLSARCLPGPIRALCSGIGAPFHSRRCRWSSLPRTPGFPPEAPGPQSSVYPKATEAWGSGSPRRKWRPTEGTCCPKAASPEDYLCAQVLGLPPAPPCLLIQAQIRVRSRLRMGPEGGVSSTP